MLTKRQLRNSQKRWERKMLPMQVRSLAGIAHEQARKAERLAFAGMIQCVVIAALCLWIAFLLRSNQ
jgi:hypothetical protein